TPARPASAAAVHARPLESPADPGYRWCARCPSDAHPTLPDVIVVDGTTRHDITLFDPGRF
ncbi:hypothetical protein, partial [uncultured Corynebacterium sp.]|uniref:hypothetical protein n=1 Tax=uncultured Corynebacterium sp. TaxID=159447 RepID=UPI0025FF4D21